MDIFFKFQAAPKRVPKDQQPGLSLGLDLIGGLKNGKAPRTSRIMLE